MRCSDHGGAESTVSGGDKYLDESSWGTKFDNDDTDSIWGPSSINTKVNDFCFSFKPFLVKSLEEPLMQSALYAGDR